MRVVNANQIDWVRFAANRGGYAKNKRLLTGESHSPNNYELSIVYVDGEYFAPRHKHNFDQFRYMLKGEFGFNKDDVLREGSLSYFPEGTPYMQRSEQPSETLLLQFGGASGSGFMHYSDLDRGKAELEKSGTFAKGVYTVVDEKGRKFNKDAYEAIWEHIHGKPVNYPPIRYAYPIVTVPENFDWVQAHLEKQVDMKSMGKFSERDIGAGFVKVRSEATHALLPERIYYLFNGQGEVDGEVWSEGMAVDPDRETDIVYTAREETVFIYFDRPCFGELNGQI